MLILIIGVKGGVGTTDLAVRLAQEMRAVGLDLADGQFAARLERATWTLARPAFALTTAERRQAVDDVVNRRITLLWTPECALVNNVAWSFVQAVANRTAVVADGGIEPPSGVIPLTNAVVIVSGDAAADPVIAYHERRLNLRFPNAQVVTLGSGKRGEVRQVARDLAERFTNH